MKRILFLIMVNFIFFNFAADKDKLTEQNDPVYRAYLERCAKISEDVLEHLKLQDLVNIVHGYHCIDYKQWQENNRLLIYYAQRENIDQISELLDLREVDVNAKNKQGETALMMAALNGNKEIIEKLIKADADVNAKSNYGRTALMLAAVNGYKEIVEILIKAGADVNHKDGYGDTALDWATQNRYNEIIDILKKAGAKS